MLRATIAALVVATVVAACYPRECDPAKDPLRCRCPAGPCDEYPAIARDAGSEAGR